MKTYYYKMTILEKEWPICSILQNNLYVQLQIIAWDGLYTVSKDK